MVSHLSLQEERSSQRGEHRLVGAGLQGECGEGQGGVHSGRVQENCAI